MNPLIQKRSDHFMVVPFLFLILKSGHINHIHVYYLFLSIHNL